jgi:hypothetical protein
MLRGSLITFRRKCGKANCRCKKGELHATFALSYRRSDGRTKILTLKAEDVSVVREAIARYNHALRALEKRAQRGITELTYRKSEERRVGRPNQSSPLARVREARSS